MTDFESDFPALGEFSTSNTNLESDPAADFLAREQAILGDEFSNATNHTITSTTSSELEAFPDITLPSASVSALSPPVSSASNVNYAALGFFNSSTNEWRYTPGEPINLRLSVGINLVSNKKNKAN